MARVAFMTIALLHAPYGDPRVLGFKKRIDANYAAAEASEGFIARSTFDEKIGEHSWGAIAIPTIFQKEAINERLITTLSLWLDLESVFAYTYSDVHAEALRKRREWFVRRQWPGYVAWWVADDHLPSWQEACARYDKLEREGPAAEAFSFMRPYGSDGQPTKIDKSVLNRI